MGTAHKWPLVKTSEGLKWEHVNNTGREPICQEKSTQMNH